MAQPDGLPFAPQPQAPGKHSFLRKLLGRPSSSASSSPAPTEGRDAVDDGPKPGLIRRMSRKVVPGLPRHQTFKRQQSERRQHLAPIQPTAEERRAVSVDRRSHRTGGRAASQAHTNPRASAPSLLGDSHLETTSHYEHSLPASSIHDEPLYDPEVDMAHDTSNDLGHADDECPVPYAASTAETHSTATAEYDAMIHEELEKVWILNLSMHFRDRSKREKFFVTYREDDHLWRRVTVSLDYRDAPPNSLEMDLIHTKYQRDKSAKIYEAIRESLPDIQFYETVTNLKLETTDGRLHVHVVEDGNEIIQYPTVSQVRHLNCRRIRERDIVFDSHMSGFVYKVNVKGNVLIKKEIPSPDTVDEFLYEVNALNSLRFSNNVIQFYGVVVDDHEEYVKGLLISYAEQGALIDLIYDNCKEDNSVGLPWSTRERWARQIVQGLADIHESGFVQGDFTLSNIVIDDAGSAKIIDINRRGCPVGWEPPEATALIESGQRLSMYIGVKSDLYQLGMVLWGLAMLEDEPEAQGRPLILGPEVNIPDWYRQMTEICLSDDPRMRLQASSLLQMFPQITTTNANGAMHLDHEPISVDDGQTLHEYFVDPASHPVIRTVEPSNGWAYSSTTYVGNGPLPYDPYHFPRGRSPPSPLPSNCDDRDSLRGMYYKSAWAANRDIAPSYSDNGDYDVPPNNGSEVSRQPTPTPTAEKMLAHDLDNLPTSNPSHPTAQGDTDCLTPVDTTGIETVNNEQEITLPGVSQQVLESQIDRVEDETIPPSSGMSTQASVTAVVPDVVVTEVIDQGYVEIESASVEKISGPEAHANSKPSAADPDDAVELGTAIPMDKASPEDRAIKKVPTPGFRIVAESGEIKDGDGPDQTPLEAARDSKAVKKSALHLSTKAHGEAKINDPKEHNIDTDDYGDTPISGLTPSSDGSTLLPKEEDIYVAELSSNKTITDTEIKVASTQKDCNSPRQQQETEAEPEPEYIASRRQGTTVPVSQENRNDVEQSHESLSGGESQQSWTHWKDAPKPIEPPRGYMCPRQTSIPLSLAGIGAAHMGMEGELFQEKMDNDFQMMARPETVPTLMITTDSRT